MLKVARLLQDFHKQVKIKHEHALKQRQGSQLSLWFCPTHICMCFRFQWCVNKQLTLSKSRPDYIWGLSVVITDHLIIITTIKNKSVQACDIWMASIIAFHFMNYDREIHTLWAACHCLNLPLFLGGGGYHLIKMIPVNLQYQNTPQRSLKVID